MGMFNSAKNTNPAFNPNNLNIVNAGTTIIGDLSSEGDIRVDGTVKGYISSKARLVLGQTSKVNGDVKAANLEVSGEIDGNIFVSELLTIKASAKITGDIVSGKLIIEAGAQFNGKCAMNDAKNTMTRVSPDEQPTSKSFESVAKQAVQ